jgi:hypothetical protein
MTIIGCVGDDQGWNMDQAPSISTSSKIGLEMSLVLARAQGETINLTSEFRKAAPTESRARDRLS